MKEEDINYEITCLTCRIPNGLSFNEPNVELSEANSEVFYSISEYCQHRGEYKFDDLKPLSPMLP